MFDYINAIIFGIVQGATEFLPVSSSGHLLILHYILPLPLNNELAFDVTLHLATLTAVVYYFRQDIVLLIKNWLASIRGARNDMAKLSWLIILGTVPAGLAALLFNDYVEEKLRSPLITATMLIIVGCLFIIIERVSILKLELSGLNWQKSLYIGIAQAIALVPGVSRSGITIIAGLGAGLNREAAARFSFLLSIPIIALASLKKIPPFLSQNLSGNDQILLLLAFAAAAVSGFLAIKYFMCYVKKYRLDIFGYYRIALGLIIVYCFLR